MPRPPRIADAPLSSGAYTLWRQILDEADATKALTPWEWIEADTLLGVLDPVSAEVDWCCIIGQSHETLGVAMYPGDVGWSTFKAMVDAGIPNDLDTPILQRAWVLTFDDREMVGPAMRAVLKKLGRRYHGPKAWPDLADHDPGYFPVPPRGEGVLQRILHTLQRVQELCVSVREKPALGEADREGRMTVAVDGQDGRVSYERRTLPKHVKGKPLCLRLDEVRIQRLSQATKHHRGVVLMDWFPGRAVMDGPDADGRPYFFIHTLIIDTQTGMVINTSGGHLAGITQVMVEGLLEVCDTQGVPELVLVRREGLLDLLRPLAKRLGFAVEHHPEAQSYIEEIRDDLVGFLEQRGSP